MEHKVQLVREVKQDCLESKVLLAHLGLLVPEENQAPQGHQGHVESQDLLDPQVNVIKWFSKMFKSLNFIKMIQLTLTIL